MGFFDLLKGKTTPTNEDYGRTLAKMALTVVQLPNSEINKITGLDLSNIDARRVKFCISIYQLASYAWHLNVVGHVTSKLEQAENIINFMFSHFNTFIDEIFDDKYPKIGNYIVDSEEMNIAIHDGFEPETSTSFKGGLLCVVLDRRIEQYFQAFKDFMGGDNIGSMGPGARLFMIHFGGREYTGLAFFGLMLAQMYLANLKTIQKMLE